MDAPQTPKNALRFMFHSQIVAEADSSSGTRSDKHDKRGSICLPLRSVTA